MLTDNVSKSDLLTLALERYESPLIRYATRILGDVERAREVVQDTFLKLCRERADKVRDHLAQWLFTVCRNRAFDVRKKDSPMTPLTEVDLSTSASLGPRPLEQLEQEETLSQVFNVVETLPDNQREVLYLKFQCDLSYKEISAITHLSVTNVGFLIHTGVKNVRERMKKETSRIPSLVRRVP